MTWVDLGPISYNGQNAVAVSGDGTLVAAVGLSTDVFTSEDHGATWTDQTGSGNKDWRGIAIDGTGSVIVATWVGGSVGETGVALSTNRGATWSLTSIVGAQQLGAISISDDGQYVLVADQYDPTPTPVVNRLYLSSDGGATFAATGPASPSAAHSVWWIVAVARDGSAFVAGRNTGAGTHDLIKSTDHGGSWTSIDPTGAVSPFDWGGAVVANGGNTIVITYGDAGAAGSTTNGGTSWNLNAAPDWFEALAGSADASVLVGCGDGGTTQALFVSTDLGATWTAQSPPGNLVFEVPGGLTASADGTQLYARRHNDSIWTTAPLSPPSPPPPVEDTGTQIMQLVSTVFSEMGVSYMWRIESGPVKQYPNRIRCKMAAFDWTTGQGTIGGSEDSMHPEMSISSSIDGGGTWSTPIIRRTLGGQGDYQRMIRVNRIGGIATQHGIRFRLDVSSPIYETFRGGRCDVDLLAPP